LYVEWKSLNIRHILHEFWIRGLGVQDSGLNQDPLLRKYAFLSITWVRVVRIEHVRAPSKGLSIRNVFCIESMVNWACGLLPNPAKVPNFQYRAWLCSMDQKFHGDDEKTQESRFWDLAQWLTAIIRPKSQNSNIRHDGILSIGNFMLMINKHFARFKLPGKLLKTKKNVLLIFVATRYFLFIFLFFAYLASQTKKNSEFTEKIQQKDISSEKKLKNWNFE
jgi:hypothetical protein